MDSPCRKCNERCPHCHSTCDKYSQFRNMIDAVNERRKAYVPMVSSVNRGRNSGQMAMARGDAYFFNRCRAR